MPDINETKSILKRQIMEKIDLSRESTDEEIRELIDSAILSYSSQNRLSLQEKTRLSKELFYTIRRLDILEELTEDSLVTEIMINGKDNIFIERKGHLYKW